MFCAIVRALFMTVVYYSFTVTCRARAHSCIREWALARTDYQTALIYHPHCAEAQKGLEDIQDTVIVLPMLGDDLLDNEAT